MKTIKNFRGYYSFLSNFSNNKIKFKNYIFENSESVFQVQKFDYNDQLLRAFSLLNPSDAKKYGRAKVLFLNNTTGELASNKRPYYWEDYTEFRMTPDWNDRKIEAMYNSVRLKFTQNPEIKEKLIKTEGYYLEEGNTWGDRFWGTVNGEGENNLGIILMQIRDEFIKNR